MDRPEVTRVLNALAELEKMCELLTTGPENYSPQRASERLSEAMNQISEFLNQPDVVNLLNPLISNAHHALLSVSANELISFLGNPRNLIRKEEPIIAPTIRDKDIIDAIDAFRRLRHRVGSFESDIAAVRQDFERTVEKVVDEIAATRGQTGRLKKQRRRSQALRAVRIGVTGLALLIGNGLSPHRYTACYAMGASSMQLAHRLLFEGL